MKLSRRKLLAWVLLAALVLGAALFANSYFARRAQRRAMDSFCRQVAQARSDVGAVLRNEGGPDPARNSRAVDVAVIAWGHTLGLDTATLSRHSRELPGEFFNDAVGTEDELASPVFDYLLRGRNPPTIFSTAAKAFIPVADRFLTRWCKGVH